MDALKLIAQDSLKADAPQFNVGDTVKVHVRIAEGDQVPYPDIRGYSYRQEARRCKRNIHSKKSSSRLRYRKSIPSALTYSREG